MQDSKFVCNDQAKQPICINYLVQFVFIGCEKKFTYGKLFTTMLTITEKKKGLSHYPIQMAFPQATFENVMGAKV